VLQSALLIVTLDTLPNESTLMSFASFLEIQNLGDEIDIESIRDDIAAILNEDGIHPAVLDNLIGAFAGEETLLNLPNSYLSYLVERIAALLPDVSFHARGRGEELRDIWVREFENGAAIFSEGSFL